MRFEKVHTVRHFWDGIRSGTADFQGAPHYFSCRFDHEADDYADDFQLYPVTPLFMERELEHSAIFRAWRDRFDRGLEPSETHPAFGGLDARYDELTLWLDAEIESLEPIPTKHSATFRAVRAQGDVPPGLFRDQEVAWTLAAA
jgi:hypothetical protein